MAAPGLLLHRPITRVPENTLGRLAGAALSGPGTFRVGEGASLRWPGGEAWIVVLGACFLLLSLMLAARSRRAACLMPAS